MNLNDKLSNEIAMVRHSTWNMVGSAFIREGDLWNNCVEDASGWFFTRAGDAFAALRVPRGGCRIPDQTEAGETFEYWANSMELPKINGEPVNLNPEKTYDSPFLSMEHGSDKAVISYPGHKDVVLDFGQNN